MDRTHASVHPTRATSRRTRFPPTSTPMAQCAPGRLRHPFTIAHRRKKTPNCPGATISRSAHPISYDPYRGFATFAANPHRPYQRQTHAPKSAPARHSDTMDRLHCNPPADPTCILENRATENHPKTNGFLKVFAIRRLSPCPLPMCCPFSPPPLRHP